MKTLELVRSQMSTGDYDLSRHALRRVVERDISEQEIRQAGQRAAIIENYPDDKYSPSSLLLGFTSMRRALHIQASLADTELVRVITVYEPDPDEWVGYSRRR